MTNSAALSCTQPKLVSVATPVVTILHLIPGGVKGGVCLTGGLSNPVFKDRPCNGDSLAEAFDSSLAFVCSCFSSKDFRQLIPKDTSDCQRKRTECGQKFVQLFARRFRHRIRSITIDVGITKHNIRAIQSNKTHISVRLAMSSSFGRNRGTNERKVKSILRCLAGGRCFWDICVATSRLGETSVFFSTDSFHR
jgi:hypothetical protein